MKGTHNRNLYFIHVLKLKLKLFIANRQTLNPKNPPYMAFRRQLILRIAAASPSRSSACDRPPACVMSCLAPGKVRLAHGWSTASKFPFMALLPGWPPPAPTHARGLNVYPAAPSLPSNAHDIPPSMIVSSSICPRKNISDGPSGRSWRRYCSSYFSKAICTWLSRPLLIPRIALSALLAPYCAKLGTATGFPALTTGR
jgi:hypothetical protein